MKIFLIIPAVATLILTFNPVASVTGSTQTAIEVELRGVEIAFAQTMADRDLVAFRSFLSPETIFFSGETTLRGAEAVAEAWSVFFEEAEAPFSWKPDAVAVLDSGNLGSTSGPVYDADGKRIGTFNSVWRKNAGGEWKVIFDRGCPPCECP